MINIASMYGMVSPDPSIYGSSGHDNPPYYGAAKAGLIQLTRYAAVHLAPHTVRVNAISPGPFPPPALAERMPDLWALLNQKPPMRRVGHASELDQARFEDWAGNGARAAPLGASGSNNCPIMVSGTGVEVP
jgi:NAD(P)-dependent dehydrogenase (short-subunit alcohol dehydrogenase family)